jgi:predicted AlkP superfamily pyrophosphatase or phosphodiesterase
MKTLAAALLLVSAGLSFAQPVPGTTPKLVVVISIDQFRMDYVDRFASQYLPARSGGKVGGFRYLSEQGAFFTDAHYTHVPTGTGPGHSAILTGSGPATNGIVGNEWYDRATKKTVYCADDPLSKTVGGPSSPMSPRNLLVSTVGDELKMATNGRSKVVGVALKDRASIFLAGHAADTVIWFDTINGAWVTSTFYANRLPDWVTKINAMTVPELGIKRVWTPMLPNEAYSWTRPAPFAPQDAKPIFTHALGPDNPKNRYRNWTTSPFGQQYVFDTATAAIDGEGLGKDDVPDLLAINLSTNDYIGHAYGPNSPEVMDISVATDRMLSQFFNAINEKVGLKNVTIVITADHGVLPIVEEAKNQYKLPAMRIDGKKLVEAVNAEVSKTYGAGEWIESFDEPNVYLNRDLIASKGVAPALVQTAVAEAMMKQNGIHAAFTRDQVLNGRLPGWDFCKAVYNSFNVSRSGDVLVFENPGNYFGGGTGTGHGSPWAYDRHVPILVSGFGVRPGRVSRRVAVTDIAPTLCRLLRVELPTGCTGTVLSEALSPGN